MQENPNYIISFSEYFWEELYEILEYIKDNFYESTVQKFNDKVFECINHLIHFPNMYSKYYKNQKYRKIFIKNYIVFYKVDYENKLVRIYHIYYSKKVSFNLISSLAYR